MPKPRPGAGRGVGVPRRSSVRHPQYRTRYARRLLRQRVAHLRGILNFKNRGFTHHVTLDEERLYGDGMTYVLVPDVCAFLPNPEHPVVAEMTVWLTERDRVLGRDFVYYDGTWLFRDPDAALEFRLRWTV